MAKPRPWRPAVLRLHRWLALSIGLVLMLNAFTGLLLLGGNPVDEALHPELFSVAPQATKVPLESVRQSLQADFPKQSLIFRPPREAHDALTVDVRGEGGWEGQLFIDPYTGKRLGQRDRFDVGMNGLFELHSNLVSGNVGKGALAICAAGFAVMLVSGLYMWWPIRWKMAFKVTLNGGRLRALFDLHRVAGAVLGLLVLVVSVATGGILAWRPATVWVNQVAGQPNLEAPTIAALSGPSARLDAMITAAEAALPGGTIGSMTLPAKPTQAVRLRKKVDGDPHPNGLSTVWLHPKTGQVLRVDRWTGFSWVFTLHGGYLGGQIVGSFVTALSGLALFGFGLTGTWLWWTRRQAKQPSRAMAAAPGR